MKRTLTILAMLIPLIVFGQWDGGFNTARDYSVSGDWEFSGDVTMDVVVMDSITINYLAMQGSQVFDSLGVGDLSNNAYIDFAEADNDEYNIYWLYMDSDNIWRSSGILKAGGIIIGHYSRIYQGALTDPGIEFEAGSNYIGLDAGYNQNAGTIRIGDTDTGGEYTSFDTLGVATFPVGGVKINPGGVPASPVEGQFCITSTGDSMGVYLASGWKWFIAGE